MSELRKALSQLKNHKAAGCDRITAEYLKAFAESFGEILLSIFKKLFASKIYPSEWASNFLKPIYKKGESMDPDNYRGLAIGAALAKLYSLILLGRLTEYIGKKRTYLCQPNRFYDMYIRPYISAPNNHREGGKKEQKETVCSFH